MGATFLIESEETLRSFVEDTFPYSDDIKGMELGEGKVEFNWRGDRFAVSTDLEVIILPPPSDLSRSNLGVMVEMLLKRSYLLVKLQ